MSDLQVVGMIVFLAGGVLVSIYFLLPRKQMERKAARGFEAQTQAFRAGGYQHLSDEALDEMLKQTRVFPAARFLGGMAADILDEKRRRRLMNSG